VILDILVLVVAVAFGLQGAYHGTVKQLSTWASIGAAGAIGKPLALVLTLALVPQMGLPPYAARIGLSLLCYAFLYVLASIVADATIGKMHGKGKRHAVDKATGFCLGVGRGAITAYAILCLFVFFESPIARAIGRPARTFTGSVFVDVARRHNLFGAVPSASMSRLEQLLLAARDPGAAKALDNDRRLKAMLGDPALAAALQDDALLRAVKAGDLGAMQSDPRVAALLKDPRITGPLTDPLDTVDR
jgi:uncharacterized membrane protein required for colicin V production